MRTRLIPLASAAALLIASSPASAWAWDADRDDAPPAPEPREAPAPAHADAAETPEGIYLVTETYVDDVVTRSGPVTVYATETAHEITGSYARVLETVSTGARSDYDGAAFNGRTAMTDGRAVAGTYYENYVRTDAGYVAVSVVFFQDDSEIARAARSSAPVTTPVAVPVIGRDPVVTVQPVPAIGSVTPFVEVKDGQLRVIPEREGAGPASGPTDPTDLGALPDRAIEVLRARRIAVSFADPNVLRWRFTGGEGVVLGPASGGPGQPFVARWDRLAPMGGFWIARFILERADGSTRTLALWVTVRAPGLVE